MLIYVLFSQSIVEVVVVIAKKVTESDAVLLQAKRYVYDHLS